MIKKNLFLIVLMIILLNSCNISSIKSDKFNKEGVFKIKLPHQTALASISKFECKKIGDSFYFSFLDSQCRTIFIYSFENRNLIKEIKIKSDEFDSYASSYLIHNLDSIFLLDHNNSDLYLINSNGITLKKIKIRQNYLKENQNIFEKNTPYPCDNLNSSGFFYLDKKIYITSSGNELNPHPELCKDIYIINIEKDTTCLVFTKPQIYWKGNWGYNYLYNIQLAYNQNINRFLISYGADHNVYITDFKNTLEKHSMKSKFLNNIKPLNLDKFKARLTKFDFEKYDYLTGSYCSFFYDDFNNRYIRIINCPLDENKFNEGFNSGVFDVKMSIIIADEFFKKRSEFTIYSFNVIPEFIINGCFYVLDHESYQKNQDSLFFNIYSLKL